VTRRPAKRKGRRTAIVVLKRRVSKLEHAVFGKRNRCGFSVEIHGDRHEQDDPDIDHVPDEVA